MASELSGGDAHERAATDEEIAEVFLQTEVRRAFTAGWSSQHGDYLFWLRSQSTFWSPDDPPAIADFWQLRDGDSITITNQWAALPAWFDLHPTEAVNANAFRMKEKIDAGYKPGEVCEGSNIWRVKPGDWILWIGDPRTDIPSEGRRVSMFRIDECVLTTGEHATINGLTDIMMFGAPAGTAFPPLVQQLLRTSLRLIKARSRSVYFDNEWRIG